MQNKYNEDFDLRVRSIMEEAQEPAPAGAWDAISSRLDAAGVGSALPGAAAVRPVRHVWRWAGAALAMAAAVALGIFFTGTSDNNSNLIDINSGSGLVAEAVAPAEKPAEICPEPAKTVAPAEKPAEIRPEPAETVVPAEKPAEICPEPAKPVVPAEKPAEICPEPAKTVVPAEKPAETRPEPAKTVVPAEKTADPFAAMEFEDALKAGKGRNALSLLLKGGTAGNNASAGKLAQAAPGSYTQSGISETSKSSFGIPFEIGLGARLQLTDRIALGAGIDYSLLTRSFSGIFTQGLSVTPGDFNHTIQYIGIPVDLFVDLVRKDDFTIYTNVGAEAEYAISNKYRLLGTDTVVSGNVKGLQWSVGAGLGVDFHLGSKVGLFAEPMIKYYFDCNQPKSIRTDKPLQMTLRAGLRFEL